MPPAVEMARPIGIGAVTTTGTALTSAAIAAGVVRQRGADRLAHQSDPDRVEADRAAQPAGPGVLGAAAFEPLGELLDGQVGAQVDPQDAPPVGVERVADRRSGRVQRTALEPGAGHHRVAAHRPALVPLDRERHVLQRRPLEPLRERRRPVHPDADVRGPQRRHRDTARGEQLQPAAVGAEPGPRRATEGEERRRHRGASTSVPSARVNRSAPVRRPSRSTGAASRSRTPRSAKRASHARTSGVDRNERGNTRPLDPTNVGSPRPGAPVAQVLRAEHVEHRCDPVGRRCRTGPRSSSRSSECVMFRPPWPASRNLRPTDGIRS